MRKRRPEILNHKIRKIKVLLITLHIKVYRKEE